MTRKTSHESWQAIQDSGLVMRMRLKVYNWIYLNGPATRSELDQALRGPNEVNPSYHKRLSELERMGIIQTWGEGDCGITGRKCIVWVTTDLASPRPLPPARQSKAETIAKYDLLIGEVIDWLKSQNGGIGKATVEAAARKLSERRDQIIPKEGKKETDGNNKSKGATERTTTTEAR